MQHDQPKEYVSGIRIWAVSNFHLLGLLGGALLPIVVFQPLGELAGTALTASFPYWGSAYVTGMLAANGGVLYLALVGWRGWKVKHFKRSVARALSNPDTVVTEALVQRLSKEMHEVLPYYVPTTTRINFDTAQLPKVVEGERYQVISPCIASVTYPLKQHEGYQDVVLRPGLKLIVDKMYTNTSFGFHCRPENPQEFLAENIPGDIGSKQPFSGHVRISIYRYHVGKELLREDQLNKIDK